MFDPVYYRYLKTGNIYERLDNVTNCTNGDQDGAVMVEYRRLGGRRKYVRNLNEFEEKYVLLPGNVDPWDEQEKVTKK